MRARCGSSLFTFFFFQAEDGIRDHCVTGVQTCALPIYPATSLALHRHHERRGEPRRLAHRGPEERSLGAPPRIPEGADPPLPAHPAAPVRLARLRPRKRSEERRVGKECKSRWAEVLYAK